MRLFLCRHGNTFEDGQPTPWVGKTEDMPLTRKGMLQAKDMALFLKTQNINPAAVYAGSLTRLISHAAIICDQMELGKGPLRTSKLDELDYGLWAGLTSKEIRTLGLSDDLDQWETGAKWPVNSGWGESECGVISRIKSFLIELRKEYKPEDTVIAVTSNGLLRFFLRFCGEDFNRALESSQLKVKTGNYCILEYAEDKWHSAAWNKSPVVSK